MGKMTPVIGSQTSRRVAVSWESKWALGRIGKAIQKYIPNVDMYDWSVMQDNNKLWIEEKWRDYDSIISNTTLLTLDKLYGINPSDDMLRRFVIIAHFPRFQGMNYFKESLENYVEGPRYAGVSHETCQEMKKFGVKAPMFCPVGADTDVFPWTHKITGPIRRLGIIGGKDRTESWAAHQEYITNKGLDMFSNICQRGNYEPVYIHGKNDIPPHELYSDIDALICCSEIEGGPLGIFEAASCGVPVLTRRVGNVKDVKGIATFETVDDALEQLKTWNENLDALYDYTRQVTLEVRVHWSMRTLLKNYLVPILSDSVMNIHLEKISEIVKASGEKLEGNVYGWDKYDEHENEMFLNKRLNLINYSRNASSILEIGFNAGHSCLLYLTSNPTSTIQLFDLGNHKYTQPCFEYLQSQFPGRLEIIYGDSRVTLPKFVSENIGKKFSLVHIDGGHTEDVVRSDILNVMHFCSGQTVVISDDDDHPHIAKLNRHFFTKDDQALESRHQYVGRVR